MTHLSQKAHDISFAVFRVATLVKNTKLRRELEDAATDLLARYEDAANPSITYHVANPIDRLDRLVAIAESTNDMKTINAQVLRRELANFQTAMELAANGNRMADANGNVNDIDISSMFEAPSAITKSDKGITTGFRTAKMEAVGLEDSNGKDSDELSGRQTAILAVIRETQFCRLRNIMDKMPEISERTIRNEIQTLISGNMVARIGGGGPASYFRATGIVAPIRA